MRVVKDEIGAKCFPAVRIAKTNNHWMAEATPKGVFLLEPSIRLYASRQITLPGYMRLVDLVVARRAADLVFEIQNLFRELEEFSFDQGWLEAPDEFASGLPAFLETHKFYFPAMKSPL